MNSFELESLASSVVDGDRRALARAITLVESSRSDHRHDAALLLDQLLPETGQATRIGVSGPPGVGKSTFIESLGLELIDAGHRVAVLAIDPTSARSGGSILGDKTRMDELVRRPAAYVRPSPSSGALGGVARRTREAVLVCEAAGFDVVVIETVGVGQSETEVDDIVDLFLLLIGPGGGDELQGMKRGITELADLLVINKADGDLAGPAQTVAADYRHAVQFLRPKHRATRPVVLTCSARERQGIAEVWAAAVTQRAALSSSGELDERRRAQAISWFWSELRQQWIDEIENDAAAQANIQQLEREVVDGKLSPLSAARAAFAAR